MITPLFDEHRLLGAKMTVFAGWEMPLSYTGAFEEVQAVRTNAGLFDLSHMGEIEVAGHRSAEFLNFVTTNDVNRLAVGDAQYTLMCDENGGIIDDLIIYRLEDQRFLLVVNASNTSSDLEWLNQHRLSGAQTEDQSAETAMVALQGPASARVIQELFQSDLGNMRRFTVRRDRVGEADCWIARTGYTGEDGYEIYCRSEDADRLWAGILESGSGFNPKPAGLAARDILRIEAGYPLYGNELSRAVTPVDAGLNWTVQFAKSDFIGSEAIRKAAERGSPRVLIGLATEDRRVLRHGYPVKLANKVVGQVTSGTYSPTLRQSIAMAYVDGSHAEVGMTLDVQIRGELCPCRVVRMPFYRAPH